LRSLMFLPLGKNAFFVCFYLIVVMHACGFSGYGSWANLQPPSGPVLTEKEIYIFWIEILYSLS